MKRLYHTQNQRNFIEEAPGYSKRYFIWPFKKKRKTKTKIRPGALSPEEVKKRVEDVGIGKQIEIVRIGYDGSIDDMPIMVEIIDIGKEGFTGRIVNLERKMIESSTEKLVYAKKGGGTIDFRFDDGDINDITVPQDEEIIQQERNVEGLRDIVSALDNGDHIIVAYYDGEQRGTVNTEGKLIDRADDGQTFTIQIEKINRIELEKKITKTFDVEKDLVIDVEFV